MDSIKLFIKTHQQTIVLVIGYILVAVLAFGLGRLTNPKPSAPDIRVEEVFAAPNNYTGSVSGIQSENPTKETGNCEGKIKGSSSMIYHVPGGSFYKRTTNPIRCFDTETEAKSAGFRKSSR